MEKRYRGFNTLVYKIQKKTKSQTVLHIVFTGTDGIKKTPKCVFVGFTCTNGIKKTLKAVMLVLQVWME